MEQRLLLVSIMTISKEELCMSMSSFVETDRGIISARDIQLSDSIKTINGFVKLEEIKVISNEDPRVSFASKRSLIPIYCKWFVHCWGYELDDVSEAIVLVVPNHNDKGIEKDTYYSILRQAGQKWLS